MSTRIELEIWNFRGIAHSSITIDGAGLIISAGNRRGKTSHLDALRAVFDASGVKVSSIKNGEDEARLVAHVFGIGDAGEVVIKRRLKRDGDKIDKSVSLTMNGWDGKKPESAISALVGVSAGIDPSKLVAMKGADRLEAVLAACAMFVTKEQLAKWSPDLGVFSFDPATHALKVVLAAHGVMFERRKIANAAAERAKGDAERAEALAAARVYDPTVASATEAEIGLRKAQVALAGAQAAAKAIADHEARIATNRKTIDDLRAQSAASAVDDAQIAAIEAPLSLQRDRVAAAKAEIMRIEANLAAARATLANAQQAEADATTARDRLQRQQQASKDLAERAHLLEKTAATNAPEPSEADEFTLDLAVGDAEALVAAARENDAAKAIALDAKAKTDAARVAIDAAARLTRQVNALADDAPRELLKACDGIEGLTVFADDVGINGVPVETLSGMERWKLCIDVARLVSKKSKVLICDNCETLDDDEIVTMGQHAARDGYTVAMGRVTRGEIVTAPIKVDVVRAK